MSGDGDAWSLLVPVKRLGVAKSRLDLAADLRAELALAMAIDTVRAAALAPAVAEILVITDDAVAAAALAALGARVVTDDPAAGLNPALVHGAALAANSLVAALAADLPALVGHDLELALRRARQHRLGVVADAPGTGTTLLTASEAGAFAPAYGPDSRAAHLAAGATDLTDLAGSSLRHDVDTLATLRVAAQLGLGAATATVVAQLGTVFS